MKLTTLSTVALVAVSNPALAHKTEMSVPDLSPVAATLNACDGQAEFLAQDVLDKVLDQLTQVHNEPLALMPDYPIRPELSTMESWADLFGVSRTMNHFDDEVRAFQDDYIKYGPILRHAQNNHIEVTQEPAGLEAVGHIEPLSLDDFPAGQRIISSRGSHLPHARITASEDVIYAHLNLKDTRLSQRCYPATQAVETTIVTPEYHISYDGNLADSGFCEILKSSTQADIDRLLESVGLEGNCGSN